MNTFNESEFITGTSYNLQNINETIERLDQFELARKLGFAKKNIKFDSYSADIGLFDKAYLEYSELKEKKYPHTFLFVGRLEDVKGIDVLVAAWRDIKDQRKDWQLVLIGNGSLKDNNHHTQ